jgi:Domain of unknown function (DUF4331)
VYTAFKGFGFGLITAIWVISPQQRRGLNLTQATIITVYHHSLALSITVQKGEHVMSHHLDSPTAREDGRVDLCDLFVFAATDPHTTVLIMTVNPDAGLSSPTSFRPDALYEFKIDTNADALEDLSFQIRFGALDAAGGQPLELRRADGAAALSGATGVLLATGSTDRSIRIAGGGQLWAGLAGDPFFADARALEQFQRALFVEQRFAPEVFGVRPWNFSGGRNVTGIVLELPNRLLSTQSIHVWATTSISIDGELVRINRAAIPLIQAVFNVVDEHLADSYNKSHPRDDLTRYGQHIASIAAQLADLAGSAPDPQAHGQRVAQRLLPDMLRYELGTPARYSVESSNGRALTDDIFDVTLSVVANTPISDRVEAEGRQRATFPYLASPHSDQAGMPPLLIRDAQGQVRLNEGAFAS